MNISTNKNVVEKWDIFEITLDSSVVFKNPFTDVFVSACFETDTYTKKVKGFYDGDNTWKIRFMPEETGIYKYFICSNNKEFDGIIGEFKCIEPSLDNHGPVKISNKYHFSYADGTPFFVMGTTAYAWTYRSEDIRKKTLESIASNGFNKVRMLVFPKYLAGFDEIDLTYEPPVLPYEGQKNNFDYKRFNVEYFKNYEKRIEDLLKLGIEADVILFHNYDFGKWGIDDGLSDDDAIFYLDYLISRISSYRNVWWSLANEYDIYKEPDGSGVRIKPDRRDWDRLGDFIMNNDPYNHLRSIHNFGIIYPNREWLTHVSYQFPNTYSLLIDLKWKYQKPVIADEYIYEGNLPYHWGNYSGREELFHHWLTVMAGGYGTHGECYVINGNKKDIFWTYGGEMVGESAPRLKFMKEIIETLPFQQMEPDHTKGDGINKFCICKGERIQLYLITENCKRRKIWCEKQSEVTIYDLWNCKIIEKFVTSDDGNVKLDPYNDMLAVKIIKI